MMIGQTFFTLRFNRLFSFLLSLVFLTGAYTATHPEEGSAAAASARVISQHRLSPQQIHTLQETLQNHATPARKAKALETFLQTSGILPEGFSRATVQRAFTERAALEQILQTLHIRTQTPAQLSLAQVQTLESILQAHVTPARKARALQSFLNEAGILPEGFSLTTAQQAFMNKTPLQQVLESIDISVSSSTAAPLPPVVPLTPAQLSLQQWIALEASDTITDQGFQEEGYDGLATMFRDPDGTMDLTPYLGLVPFMPFAEPVSAQNLTSATISQLHPDIQRTIRNHPNDAFQLFLYPIIWQADEGCRQVVAFRTGPGATVPEQQWIDLLSRERVFNFGNVARQDEAARRTFLTQIPVSAQASFEAYFTANQGLVIQAPAHAVPPQPHGVDLLGLMLLNALLGGAPDDGPPHPFANFFFGPFGGNFQ